MSVGYRSTCRPTIGQSLSVDISTDISVECRSTYRPVRPMCRLICRPTHLGRHIDRLSTDVSVDMSTDTSRPTYRSRGAQNTHDPFIFQITLPESFVWVINISLILLLYILSFFPYESCFKFKFSKKTEIQDGGSKMADNHLF